MLQDGIVGDWRELGIGGCWTVEESGSLEDVVELEGVVLLDDLGVDVGNEE